MVLPKQSKTNDKKVTQQMFPPEDEDSSTADEAENEQLRADADTERFDVPDLEPTPDVDEVVVKTEDGLRHGGLPGPSEGRSDEQRVELQTDKKYITLEVRRISSLEQIIQFKMKRTATFQKLMTQFCHRFNINQAETRFLFDGGRIGSTSTPNSLEMEDGDLIEAHVEMLGGNVY